MITVTDDYKTAAQANYRDPRARVRVTWGDAATDNTMFVSANDVNRTAILPQVTNKATSMTHKWFLTNENTLDGTFYPFPSDPNDGEVGYFSQTPNSGQVWTTNPKLTLTFDPINLSGNIVTITFDDAYNEYSSYFFVRFYRNSTLLVTKTLQPSTVTVEVDLANDTVSNCNKIEIEMSSWSVSGAVAKIAEVAFSTVDTYYGDDIISINVLEEMETNEGSLPIGNISANEMDVSILNTNDRFTYGNTNSAYNNLVKKERKIELWLGFVLPDGSTDVSDGNYIVETIDGQKVGFQPYGVYWSDDWTTDRRGYSASTFARDRMDVLRRLEFDDSDIYYNTTLYDLADTVLTSANNKLKDKMEWEIDTSLQDITIPVGYFDKVSYFDALKDISIAALTITYVDRTGKIIVGRTLRRPT